MRSFPSLTRATAVVLAATAHTLTACSDAPSALPAAYSSAHDNIKPQLATLTPVVARAVVGMALSQPVPGATIRFRMGADSLIVADNSADDLDKTDGYFKVVFAGVTPTLAQVISVPEKYALLTTGANGGSISSDGSISFGLFQVAAKPVLRVTFFSGRLLTPGATISITGPNGIALTAKDDVFDVDLDGNSSAKDGVITRYLPQASSTYWVCETAPPKGYLLAQPSCKQFGATWGSATKISFSHAAGVISLPEG